MVGTDHLPLKISFGTSGWRGKLDQDFVLPNVQRAAQGVAEYYNRHIKKGSMLLGFDPRRGNREFAAEVASILAYNNIPVRIVLDEPTPTPVLAYLAHSDEQIAGVVNLTASHNISTDDGFKFSPHHGGAADTETTNLISKYANETVIQRHTPYESGKSRGLIREIFPREAIRDYVESYMIPTLKQLKAWQTMVNYVKSDRSFRLVLDPMQGTSVRYLDSIYRHMEAEAGRQFTHIIHSDNKDPEFKEVNGAPNPTEAESIKELVAFVSQDSHTLGLATDGDGDRFGVIDFGGKELSANEVIAMLAYFLAQKGLRGAIGKTVATSSLVNAVAEHLGLELIETPVGFKWFVEKNVKEGKEFLVAGEESAHVGAGPLMTSWDDGIAIGLLCLWIVAETRNSLASYREKLETTVGKRFFYRRDSIALTPELKEKAVTLIKEASRENVVGRKTEDMAITRSIRASGMTQKVDSVVTLDGLKVVFKTCDWLCIRISGTENVARLYTEVTSKERQEAMRQAGMTLLGVEPTG